MDKLLGATEFFTAANVRQANHAKGAAAASGEGHADFSSMLSSLLDNTNETELQDQLNTLDLVNGNAQDLHTAMIAAVKAENALRLTLQVRNKCVDAYSEIMRMQV